jgi:hypothetical protein
MATALRGHASREHAHAKPWAWHPVDVLLLWQVGNLPHAEDSPRPLEREKRRVIPMRYQHPMSSMTRRGAVLLVVLSMLTLFAVVGLSFVFYANAEAIAARTHRESVDRRPPIVEPDVAFSFFLGQLLQDVPDDALGVKSAMRGHSILRNMFGGVVGNNLAFNGTGRLRNIPSPWATDPAAPPEAKDLFYFINYTYFRENPPPSSPLGFLHDPERYGLDPTKPWRTRPTDTLGPILGGLNAPYTYFDHNTMFLAAVKSDGTVLLPSFHRPWMGFGSLDPSNPKWNDPNPWFRYMVLRPRPIDHPPIGTRPGFPPTAGPNGDVQNLIGGPGGPDSFWMDLGAPIMRTPDGRKYKMLFAPLIMDLDAKINLNLHGNILGRNPLPPNDYFHLSHQSFGPWAINLSRVLNRDPQEWTKLFVGTPHAGASQFTGLAPLRLYGKFGKDQKPGNGQPLPPSLPPLPRYHFYGQLDRDEMNLSAGTALPTGPIQLPGSPGGVADCPFPVFPAGYDNNNQVERDNEPNRYDPKPTDNSGFLLDLDRKFALHNLEKLWRFGDTSHEALGSELLRLCPLNFNDPRMRRLVTLLSGDRNVGGAGPWGYHPNNYESLNPYQFPKGTPLPFPSLDWRLTPPPGFFAKSYPGGTAEFTPNFTSAFGGAARARIDLGATLGRYPLHDGQGEQTPSLYNRRFDQPQLDPTGMPASPLADDPLVKLAKDALSVRQSQANEIYRQLLKVAAVPPVQDPWNPTDPELVARRWLAQLAVNIVDYMDEDDIITPFNFYNATDDAGVAPPGATAPFDFGAFTTGDKERPRYWVFGTELPRVVLNEIHVEYAEPPNPAPNQSYPNKVWVELYNPMKGPAALDPSKPLQRQDGFPVQFQTGPVPGGVSHRSPPPTFPLAQEPATAFAPYKIVIADGVLKPQFNDNVTGKPGPIHSETTNADFANPAELIDGGKPQPPHALSPPGMTSPYIEPRGFLLVGPPGADLTDSIKVAPAGAPPGTPSVPPNTPIVRTDKLQYPSTFDNAGNRQPDHRTTGVTVLLRRLANPHIPFDPEPKLTRTDPSGQVIHVVNPWYNPWITVDYLEDNPLRDMTPPKVAYQSRVKRQPYAGKVNDDAGKPIEPAAKGPVTLTPLPQPPLDPPPDRILYHSFGNRNVSPTTPPEPLTTSKRYDWLVHLDRPVINPIELLHVSAYQPHLLTQQFMTGDDGVLANRFNHYAPWLDQNSRLYRFLEFVQARAITPSTPIRGLINLNTLLDLEVFQALCDHVPGLSTFSPTDVDDIFIKMISRRTPGLISLPPGGGPGPNDKPILSLGTGIEAPGSSPQNPLGLGIENTLLQSYGDPANPARRLFQAPSQPPTLPPDPKDPRNHPYVQLELLSKIYNHVTNRSNVFAVWVTVGFFEVNDDTTQPAKLGQELGSAEGRQVRHRMFAIVDRSTATSFARSATVPFDPRNNSALVPYYTIIDGR